MEIINPKAEKAFPTAVEFSARIQTFTNDLAYEAVCHFCGGKMAGRIKAPGVGANHEASNNQIVLETLKRRHACPHKRSLWGDKNIAKLVAPDILAGWDKLKELELKGKA